VTAEFCYVRRVSGLLIVALAVLGTTVEASSSPPTVTYAEGKVSADFQGVPLDEAIAALARETGVEFRGELLDSHEVNVRFEGAGFRDVLDRLLGEQNFTITYDANGRPRRVALLSMRRPGTSPPPPVLDGFAALIARYPEVELPPVLTKALGVPRGRLPWVLGSGFRHRDPAVGAAAASLFVHQVDSDSALHDALMHAEDGRLTVLLRAWAGTGLPRLVAAFASESQDPLLRSRARRLLESLQRETPSI
jgi:hypothetical protein